MTKTKKLTVRRQTIRALGALDLGQARGGLRDSEATCAAFDTEAATCPGTQLLETEATCRAAA
jgi:hypothetical protein